ncbi:helix-turn-helix transcriptional regulator [Phycicoccus sonneratiae]|uniref:Helix-turn-helix transcriptional regulator n=1 Tax=Phycicoccus sonneratiae TaxID=2807628 RepID=A0ABS2CGE8_9MICO|nr:helix-turn-helix transcriptional regulator [Phycicoccus sonneraticus]MBM6398895.1 helix-turn-helix transcriptional regulator [Phycicoccus sonneraticus]
MGTGGGEDAAAFFRWVHGLATDGDRRMVPLGDLAPAFDEGVGSLAGSVKRSVWHMTFRPTWSEVRMARPIAEVSRRRGIDARYVADRLAASRLPLLSSHHFPYFRNHPVVAPLLVVDTRAVFVGAPPGHQLAGEVWTSTAPQVVDGAIRVFDAVWRAATDPHPDGVPRFTRRMVDVAFLLTDGASDREIARSMGVSERTVSHEVGEIIRRLGARNRAHAIALIGDAGP